MMINIAIRLDVGKNIGSGHLVRCTALADALNTIGLFEICFICRNELKIEIPYPVLYLDNKYLTSGNGYDFPSILDEIPEMERIIRDKNIDCLIVDHYGAKDDYFYAFREKIKYFICIDDHIQRNIPVDVIINGNVYGIDADYGIVPTQLLGGKYTLIRSMFSDMPDKEISSKVRRVYITSGGADPTGFCKVISDVLSEYFLQLEIHVIVGNDFEKGYIDSLHKNLIFLHENADMKQCMLNADIFISGAGSTLYELAVCGVPSLSYVLADDQNVLAEYMHSLGTTYVCGIFNRFNKEEFIRICEKFFFDVNRREFMHKMGKKNINAKGAEEVAKCIKELLINIEK